MDAKALKAKLNLRYEPDVYTRMENAFGARDWEGNSKWKTAHT